MVNYLLSVFEKLETDLSAMCAIVVSGQSSARIEVKKSIFFATVKEIHTEAEALAFLEEMRKTYWDARHNCYAYILGAKNEIRRFSDDKEPQGTAGKPILEAIASGGFQNTAVVVTRYFGGVLLGTGGLVRAYSQAASLALAESPHFPVFEGNLLTVRCSYSDVGKLQYLIGQSEIPLMDSVYAEDVTFTLAAETDRQDEYVKKITEAANGAASIEISDPVHFIKDGSSARLYQF